VGTFVGGSVVGPDVNTSTDPLTQPRTDRADLHGSSPEGAPELAPLTPFDRCDSTACSAQAYVRAQLPSGLELVFCGHHGHELVPALAGQGAVVRDDSHLLVEDRLTAPR
jgi:hypothetical protein